MVSKITSYGCLLREEIQYVKLNSSHHFLRLGINNDIFYTFSSDYESRF